MDSLKFPIAFGSLAVTAGILLAAPSAALAQAAYGSYVGVGPAFGLTGGGPDEGSQTAAVVAFRYRILEIPISLRAQGFFFSDSAAIVPTVSYDFPLNWNTDLYLGAGVSFVLGDDASPVGSRTSFAIQPGIDHTIPNSDLVLFGNAIIAFDAYRESSGSAVSVQGGVGLRF
jgi:hypothetical protein